MLEEIVKVCGGIFLVVWSVYDCVKVKMKYILENE